MATTVDDLDIQISVNVDRASKSIDSLINKMDLLSNSIGIIGKTTNVSFTNATKNFNNLSKSIPKVYTATQKTSGGIERIAKRLLSLATIIKGINKLSETIESTADYIEAFNYFNVALGKIGSDWSHQFEKYGYDNAESYAESFSTRLSERLGKLSGLQVSIGADGKGLLTEGGLKNLGLNIQEITQYASQLASVTNSVGQTGEVSLAAASSFTKLAGDISSLFNVDYSSVSKNLQSGLIGQSRALYKYGIDITNATLQTYAYELGLSKAVSEMTQAEKMQLRMLAILDQSKVSWGDLANTINSPSNMIRQFTNNLKETGMVLGQLFVPILQKVLPVINGVTIAIKRLLVNIANLLGIKIDFDAFGQGYSNIGDEADVLSDALDDVNDSAKKATGSLSKLDELNVINTPESSKSASAVGGGGIDLTQQILDATAEYEKAWQEAFDKMESKAQAFADKFEKIFEPIKKLFKDISIGDWFAVGGDVSSIVSGIFNTLSDAISKVNWRQIGDNVGEFISGIDWTEILKSVGKFIWEGINASIELWEGMFNAAPIETAVLSIFALPVLVGFGSKIITLIASPFTEAANLITPIISSLGTIIGGLSAPVLAVAAAVTALVAGLGYVFATNEEIRESFDNAISSIRDGLQPALEFLTGTLLPNLKMGWEGILEILTPLGEFLSGAFTSIWQDMINPALTYIGETVLPKVTECFENLWNNVLVPFGAFLGDVLEPVIKIVSDVLTMLWENVAVPLADAIGNVLGKAFEGLCDIFNEMVIPRVNTVIEVFQYLWDNVFGPIIDFLWDVFKPVFEDVFKGIGDIIDGLSKTFGGLIDFITGIFTNDWEKAWNGVKDIFSGIWDTLSSSIKIPLNAVIGIFEGFANKVIDAWNAIKSAINSVQIDIPSFVPGIGGQKFGFNLSMTGHLNIPRFATGGFPEDGLFMANHNELVGQFSNGKTAVANNEQITNGIKQGVREAVAEVLVPYLSDIAQSSRVTANKEFGITQNEVGKAARNYARDYTIRTGRPAFT